MSGIRDLRILPDRPPYVAGRWYHAGDGNIIAAATVAGQDLIKAHPFWLSRPVVISELAARVTAIHAANNFQLAIYANNPATNRPTGSELAKTGNLPTDVAGVIDGPIVGGSVALAPGLYWACINNSGATAHYMANALLGRESAWLIGSTSDASMINGGAGGIWVSTPVTFGTWGDLTAAVWTEFFTGAQAAIIFKAA